MDWRPSLVFYGRSYRRDVPSPCAANKVQTGYDRKLQTASPFQGFPRQSYLPRMSYVYGGTLEGKRKYIHTDSKIALNLRRIWRRDIKLPMAHFSVDFSKCERYSFVTPPAALFTTEKSRR